ncbi:unnamed protein product [Boreogadus saida]
MPVCFVPECTHSSRHGCSFFRFPSDVKTRNRWLKQIRQIRESQESKGISSQPCMKLFWIVCCFEGNS